MALNPAFAGEGIGDDTDTKVGFARTIEFFLMAGMQMAFIDHFEMGGRKSSGQLFSDRNGNGHFKFLILVRRITAKLNTHLSLAGFNRR